MNRPPDVIVSDINMNMPGMNGLEMLMLIRKLSPEIPIILMTASSEKWPCKRVQQLGAVAVFDKPFNLRQLQALVTRLVTQARDRVHGATTA